MKLSSKTINLLQNFSSINQSILFKEGNIMRTISVMKNILAEAKIEEEFPRQFAIYDLNQFLNGLKLYNDPELDFESEKYALIKEGNVRSKYFFSDPNVIITPPDKEIVIPSDDVTFNLETKELDKLIKASNVYQLPDLSVIGESGVVKMVVRDKKNETSNDFAIIVGETDKTFTFNFKVENIKIISGSYTVIISSKLISKFVNKSYDVTYWIALEPDSTFG